MEIAEDRGEAEDDNLRLLRSCIEQLDEFDRALVVLYLDGNRYSPDTTLSGAPR